MLQGNLFPNTQCWHWQEPSEISHPSPFLLSLESSWSFRCCYVNGGRRTQWKRRDEGKGKGKLSSWMEEHARCDRCALPMESHVETLIYLFVKNTTKLRAAARSVHMGKWKRRRCWCSSGNPRKIAEKISRHLQFFGCCRSIQSISGTFRESSVVGFFSDRKVKERQGKKVLLSSKNTKCRT